jgi:hypothetical protein
MPLQSVKEGVPGYSGSGQPRKNADHASDERRERRKIDRHDDGAVARREQARRNSHAGA